MEGVVAVGGDPLPGWALCSHVPRVRGRHDGVERLGQALSVLPSSSVVRSCSAEPRLFLDVSYDSHVSPLPLAGRSAAMGAQATVADTRNLAKMADWEIVAMLFNEPEPSKCLLCKHLPGSAVMAFGSRRRPWPFSTIPILLQNTVFPSKPLILPGKVEAFG